MSSRKTRDSRQEDYLSSMTKQQKKELLKTRKSDLSPELRRVQRILQKHKKRKRRLILLIIELIIILVLVAGLYIWSKIGKIDFKGGFSAVTNRLDAKTQSMLSGYTTIACFGLDNRENGDYDSGRSDSIMIFSIDNDTKQVSIVSIYRDTYLDIDGKGTYTKANAAYNNGGAEAAVNMLNRNLDMDIEDYVSVDFKAVADAVDAVGGVEITVDNETAKAMMDCWEETENVVGRKSTPVQGSDQPQLLDGVQALCYARTRHTTGDDFRRASRQREVVEQLITKAKGASLSQLNKLIDAVFPEISTSLSASELLGLASGLQNYTLAKQIAFPFSLSTKTMGNSGDCVIPCTLESNVRTLYEQLYNETTYEPSDAVKERSNTIQKRSGYDESDGKDYGYSGLDTDQSPEKSDTTEAQTN